MNGLLYERSRICAFCEPGQCLRITRQEQFSFEDSRACAQLAEWTCKWFAITTEFDEVQAAKCAPPKKFTRAKHAK